jgi:hypothetical protein
MTIYEEFKERWPDSERTEEEVNLVMDSLGDELTPGDWACLNMAWVLPAHKVYKKEYDHPTEHEGSGLLFAGPYLTCAKGHPGYCKWCGHFLAECELEGEHIPPKHLNDDEAWETEAKYHNEGCEYVYTRAHRLHDGLPPVEGVI